MHSVPVLFSIPGGALAEEANAFVLLVIDFLRSFLWRRKIHHSVFTNAIAQGEAPQRAAALYFG